MTTFKNFKHTVYRIISIVCPKLLFRQCFYSQTGEDILFISQIGDLRKKKGFYVDIGAHHPYRFSNTALLYNHGWSGINIEPTPSLYKTIKRYRKRDININCGVAEKENNLFFYIYNEGALNTFDEAVVKERENLHNYNYKEKKKIKTYPLHWIFDKYLPEGQRIDLLTIDAEGLDFEIVKSNDWNKYTPKFILVECFKSLEDIFTDPLYEYLKCRNYSLIGKICNTCLFKHNKNYN